MNASIAMEAALTRYAIFSFAVSVLVFMVTMWVLYFVIKSAIRDGIIESGLVERWATTVKVSQRPFHDDSRPD
jgi:hypothetical protein